jgi:hypothetical protein
MAAYTSSVRYAQSVEQQLSALDIRTADVELLNYRSPLSKRYKYASEDIGYVFSDHNKVLTWRKLWLWLAKAQQVSSLKCQVELVPSRFHKQDLFSIVGDCCFEMLEWCISINQNFIIFFQQSGNQQGKCITRLIL